MIQIQIENISILYGVVLKKYCTNNCTICIKLPAKAVVKCFLNVQDFCHLFACLQSFVHYKDVKWVMNENCSTFGAVTAYVADFVKNAHWNWLVSSWKWNSFFCQISTNPHLNSTLVTYQNSKTGHWHFSILWVAAGWVLRRRLRI